MTNVFLDLQNRQWRQVEGWNVKSLGQFAEERALLNMRKCWSCRSVLENKQSTLALAFSCDGLYMASSHLTHEIVIHKTQPHLDVLRVLSCHPSTNRSPWCLTFHPSHPLYLLSGCLGGSVLLWDVQDGSCLCAWLSGVSSPINSLVFLPSHPEFFLVAYDTRLCLMHHCGDSMEPVWTSKTATVDVKVRLVLHHPDSSRILTAVTNQRPLNSHHNFLICPPQKSSYRLQMYPYSLNSPPNLEDSSAGLIAMAIRVLSPQSVVLTSRFVISSSKDGHDTKLSVHSIERHMFGQCLFSTILTPRYMGVASLDLSACQRFLLLSLSGKQFLYHMESQHSFLKVFRLSESAPSLDIEPFCELSGLHLVNVARWQPAQSGEGGVCVGTQQGGVVWWGSRQSQLGKDEELTRRCRLDWFPKSTHKHLQS